MWKPTRLPYYIEAQKRHERLKKSPSSFNNMEIFGFKVQGNRARAAIGATFIFLCLYFLTGFSFNASSSAVSTGSTGSKSAGPGLTDEGVAGTTCSRSYDGKKPVTQYAVMIDAGSSGSRVHVYKFNNCGPVPALEDEVFEMLEPGLSSYPDDPEAAAASLDKLMETAVKSVPSDLAKCTHIAVKATAGLRMLGEDKSKAILAAVKSRIESNYPFKVVEDQGVVIMEGRDEGVYAWITANYLLGNIGTKEKTPTAAVFDLGGGSTQIVFEPTFKEGVAMAPGDHKYELDFGGRHFVLYQHSHLGLGLNEAKKQINSAVAKSFGQDPSAKIVNPCLPPNTSASVKVGDSPIKMYGPSHSSELQCRKFAEDILAKDAVCQVGPCSFNGVHQPSLTESFLPSSDMYVFSFFYDRTYPLGMPSTFSLSELKDLTSKVCGGAEYHDSFAAIPGAIEALEKNPEWCLDLSFMVSLLRTGYDIPGAREVKIAKKIDNKELGWCLGASLPLLELPCK